MAKRRHVRSFEVKHVDGPRTIIAAPTARQAAAFYAVRHLSVPDYGSGTVYEGRSETPRDGRAVYSFGGQFRQRIYVYLLDF